MKDQTDNLLYYEDIVETIREPLLVLDSGFKVLSANRNFYNTFKVTPKETVGNLIYEITDRKEADELRRTTQELQAFNEAMIDREERIIELKEESTGLRTNWGGPHPMRPCGKPRILTLNRLHELHLTILSVEILMVE